MSVSKLIDENAKKCLMFNEEYDRVFTDIICYIRLNTKESIETEEVLSDLIDIFLENQNKGVSVDNVINGNHKDYCKDIITTLNNGKNPKIVGTSDLRFILIDSLLILILMSLPSYIGKAIKAKELIPYNITLDLVVQIILLPIAVIFMLNYMSENLIFTPTKNTKNNLKEFFVFFMIMTLLIVIPVGMHLLKWDILLFSINIFIIFVLTLILSALMFLQIKRII